MRAHPPPPARTGHRARVHPGWLPPDGRPGPGPQPDASRAAGADRPGALPADRPGCAHEPARPPLPVPHLWLRLQPLGGGGPRSADVYARRRPPHPAQRRPARHHRPPHRRPSSADGSADRLLPGPGQAPAHRRRPDAGGGVRGDDPRAELELERQLHGVTPLAGAYAEKPFWWDDAGQQALPEQRPPDSADAVIIGGGYTGVVAGWELARRGQVAVVLEQEHLGFGASTRNGGMVLPGFKAGLQTLLRKFGERGLALARYSLDAVGLVERTIAQHGIDCGYQPSGHLELAYRPSHAAALKASLPAQARVFGDRVRFLERDQLEAEIGSSAYHGGLLVEIGGGLQPAKYHAGLVRAARRAGAIICERTPATGLTRLPGGGFQVVTPGGSVSAAHVLLATNGYTTGLVPAIQRRGLPGGGHPISTPPLGTPRARALNPAGPTVFS